MSDFYDGDIHFTDMHPATLFEKLENLDLMDNTVIVITSDHGYVMPGKHDNYEGYGNNLYEGAVRVPLIFHYPSKIPGNLAITDQIRQVDIAPTILELAGIERFEEFQGVSLMPFFNGDELEELTAYTEAMDDLPERKSVRTENYKYIYIPELSDEDMEAWRKEWNIVLHQTELFDMISDPEERQTAHLPQTVDPLSVHACRRPHEAALLVVAQGRGPHAESPGGLADGNQVHALI